MAQGYQIRCSWHRYHVLLYPSFLLLFGACGDVQFSKANEATIESVCQGDECATGFSEHETFHADKSDKADILFVIDTSGSMATERAQLGSRLANFTAGLKGIDWRICVTTTDPYKEGGQLLSFGSSIGDVLTADTPNYNTIFLDLLKGVPGGTGDEQGIHSLFLAVSKNKGGNCLRDDAALSAVIISDEDERSTGGYPEFINDPSYMPLEPENYPQAAVDEVAKVFGKEKKFTVHSIVVPTSSPDCYASQLAGGVPVYYGKRYEELSQLTGGVIGNICASDYAEQLQSFADSIRKSLDSIALKCSLAGQPQVTFTPNVPGIETSWQGNKVYFKPSVPKDVQVSVDYNCAPAI